MSDLAEQSGQETTHSALRVLIDTNVVLDWLLDRKPWSELAQPLWDTRDNGRVVAYLPASVVTDIFYIMRRQTDIATAFMAVDRVFAAFGILAVDGPLLQQARALPGADFEDNVQIACAINAELDMIITRNPADFRHSPVPVIDPPQIASHLPLS
ncbi:MAG: PIN domain-containing protein [Chloroflexota bacterium]|nr:PIN domain-containing protein [Chloroflexota bacterium]